MAQYTNVIDCFTMFSEEISKYSISVPNSGHQQAVLFVMHVLRNSQSRNLTYILFYITVSFLELMFSVLLHFNIKLYYIYITSQFSESLNVPLFVCHTVFGIIKKLYLE